MESASVPTSCTPKAPSAKAADGVMILENLDLNKVPDGEYFLFAPPVLVGEVDGAPVRAILVDWED